MKNDKFLKELDKIEKKLKKIADESQKQIKALKEQLRDSDKETKPEKGKWYNTENGIGIFCVTHVRDGDVTDAYGIGNMGYWICEGDEGWRGFSNGNTPATDDEVFEALKKEAIKLGFKKGVTVRRTKNLLLKAGYCHNGLECTLEDDHDAFEMINGNLFCYGRVIFCNGLWAEIIEDKLELNGETVTIDGSFIEIGCRSISAENFKHVVGHLLDYQIDTIHHKKIGEIKVSDLKALLK